MAPALRSGVLVVDKPAGRTSFDVVAHVRRRLHVRRVGHAGTLDPDATGVLPVLVGEATKLMPYVTEHAKEYRAAVRFGVRTETQDMSGRVLSETAVPLLTRESVTAAAAAFIGHIRQTPPMYSALHHEGRRLYELAREGVEVERAARDVTVYELAVEDVQGGRATLRVVCGKGTYVRTLVADLGDALEVGAAVEQLTRLRVGPFTIEHAVTGADLDTLPAASLEARVLPPAAALVGWPEVHLDAARADAFRHGQALDGGPAASGLVRVHETGGALIGVGAVDATRRLRPIRILHADHSDARVLPA